MTFLKRIILLLAATGFLFSCKHKKKPSMAGEDTVKVSDFIDFFQPLSLPAQFADSILMKKEKDSLLISYKVFTQFVPDSVLSKVFGKGLKPKIYAIGKATVPNAENYLFVKTAIDARRALFVLAFDKKEKFIASLAALRLDQNNMTRQTVTMDRRFSINKSIIRRNADGSTSEGKDVYVLNEPGKNFMMVVTDALEDKPVELINPIDTLPRKQKYAADYGFGKFNLVSIRDGRKADRITFFVHFEKNNGECTGELKGEAILRSPNTAEYRADGDPCILKFTFSGASVSLTEESCGSRRGVQCLFDGSFARKKDNRPPPPKKQVKKK
jgi:hypothetical protein